MSFFKRLRLLFGILIVMALVGALFVYLNYSMSLVASSSAKLLADTYTVGTVNSGIVSQQFVQVGDTVTTGEKLFTIKRDTTNLGTSTNGSSTADIILTATGDGTVSDINYLQGAFVPANKEVATIAKANSLYVEATYQLSAPDYARVKNGSTVIVTLPNDMKVNATVFHIAIKSSGNSADTVVQARLQNSRLADSSFSSGTPVSTELHLTGKTLLETIKETAHKLLQPKAS